MSESAQIIGRIEKDTGLKFPGDNHFWDVASADLFYAFIPRPIAYGGFSFILKGDGYERNGHSIGNDIGPVAAKIPKPNNTVSKGILRHEYQLLAGLDHPGIIQPLDLLRAELGYFQMQGSVDVMVMPWIQAPNLYERMKQIGHFDISNPVELHAFLTIASQLGDTLDYTHSQGVAWGDASTTNIFPHFSNLNSDHPEQIAHTMIADFGRSDYVQQSVIIEETVFIGRYDAPEVALKPGVLPTPSSDIYSFGAILYEMLTGWHPNDPDGSLVNSGKDIFLLNKMLNDAAHTPISTHLRTSSTQLNRDLEAIFAGVLAKDPDERYASAGEVANDLISVLSN